MNMTKGGNSDCISRRWLAWIGKTTVWYIDLEARSHEI